MKRLAFLLIAVVAGCGGSGAKTVAGPGVGGTDGAAAGSGEVADPIPRTKGPDCAIVADKLATVAHAEAPDRQAEARDKLRTRCTDDKWSDEARNCFATVETDSEIEGCNTHLTDPQRAELQKSAPDMGPKDPWGSKTSSAPGGPADGSSTTTRGGTRGAKQKTSSDPCEGGERK